MAQEDLSVTDLPRNSVAACKRYYLSQGKRITMEDFHILLMLQDDSAELKRLAKSEKWVVYDGRPTLEEYLNRTEGE